MTSQEDIDNQLMLLQAHRQTLALHLRQRAIHSEAYVPPAVIFNIGQAREQIRLIKLELRQWGVTVDDQLNDFEPLPTPSTTTPPPHPPTTPPPEPQLREPIQAECASLRIVLMPDGTGWSVYVENSGQLQLNGVMLTLRHPPMYVVRHKFEFGTLLVGQRAKSQALTPDTSLPSGQELVFNVVYTAQGSSTTRVECRMPLPLSAAQSG